MDIEKIKYWDYNKQEYRLRNKPTRKLTYNQLQNKIDNLNKGIDELIKKYEDYIRYWENEVYRNSILIIEYKQFIQDLKKLKGE